MLKRKINKYYASQRLDDNQKKALTANLSAMYEDKGSTAGITASHSIGNDIDEGTAYAKGPGLWTIGVTAAAVALIAGVSFFGSIGTDPISSSPSADPSEPPAQTLSPEEQEFIANGGVDPNEDRTPVMLSISAEGYDLTGRYGNEISVTDLEKTKSLTINLELGDSNCEILPGDLINSARYYIFFNGYSALDLTQPEASDLGYAQFINEMGTGEFVKTEDGFKAQYTFDFSNYSEISLKEKTFNIVALAVVDDYQGEINDMPDDFICSREIFNTAYDEQNKISYLEELYADESPSMQGPTRFHNNYDMLLKQKYYQDPDGEYHKYLRSGTGIIEDKENGKVYLSSYNSAKEEPEYLFENAYYIFTFIDGENGTRNLTPLEVDGELIYQPLINCRDADGERRFFFAELGDMKDVSGVDIFVIPASSHNMNFGAYIGKAIGCADSELISPNS